MLIVALVLAVISLAALVTAVVTSNEVIAWACIGFSALGVLLLIVDAIRDRHRAAPGGLAPDRTEVIAPVETTEIIEAGEDELPEGEFAEGEPADDDYPDDPDAAAQVEDYPDFDELEAVEDHPDEVVYDDPDHDTPGDDESSYPVPAEQAAIHVITEDDLAAEEAEDAAYDEPVRAVESGEATYTITYAEVPPAESPSATVSYVVSEDDDDADEASRAAESGDDRGDH